MNDGRTVLARPVGGRAAAQSERPSAYDKLKALLVDCRFAPGEQLQVANLARRLNTSTTPVREALSRLHAEGFLVSQPHRGYFVKMPSLREMISLYEFGYLLFRHSIVKGAASGIGDAAALEAVIEEVLKSTDGARGDVDLRTKQIEGMVRELMSIAENDVMLSAIRNYQERTHYVRVVELRRPQRMQECAEAWQILIDKMKGRDSAAAVAILDERWKRKMQVLPDLIKEAVSRHFA